jgi:hypothetical protein
MDNLHVCVIDTVSPTVLVALTELVTPNCVQARTGMLARRGRGPAKTIASRSTIKTRIATLGSSLS